MALCKPNGFFNVTQKKKKIQTGNKYIFDGRKKNGHYEGGF